MRAARSLALTFDDGPDPVWTPRLLDLLTRLRAGATFFLIAPRAASHPDLWGDRAPWSARVAREYGLRLVGWTVDTHDWRGDSAREMFAAASGKLEPGAIVLAHDGIGPGARREGAAETLGFVELAAAHATAKGLRLEAL